MYATVADLKAYLAIERDKDDALLSLLIQQAQTFIETNTNRKFECPADSTHAFDMWQDTGSMRYTGHREPWYQDATLTYGLGRVLQERIGGYGWQRTLYLDDDLCQITQVVNGDGSVVPPTAYVTEPRNAKPWYALTLKESAGLLWTYQTDVENAIQVTGRWAYSISPPDDIKLATLQLATYFYRRRGAENAGADQPQVSPSGVVLFPAGVPAIVTQVLGQYQKLGGV